VEESCTTFSSRSRRPVRELLDTCSYKSKHTKRYHMLNFNH